MSGRKKILFGERKRLATSVSVTARNPLEKPVVRMVI